MLGTATGIVIFAIIVILIWFIRKRNRDSQENAAELQGTQGYSVRTCNLPLLSIRKIWLQFFITFILGWAAKNKRLEERDSFHNAENLLPDTVETLYSKVQ